MECLGFDTETIDLIMSLYENSTADVITKHGTSPQFQVKSGVRQGDPLSPTIFILCTCTILKYIKSMSKGYIIGSNSKELNKMFNILKEWSIYNNMNINPDKSAYAWNHDIHYEQNFNINNKPIEYLSNNKSYKYLGIYINLNLIWNDHTKIMQDNYKKSVQTIARKYYLSPKMKTLLVNTTAQAMVAYSMSFIIYADKVLQEWDIWTVDTLQKSCKLKANASHEIWWNILKLNSFKNINPIRFISSKLWLLNNSRTIAGKSKLTDLMYKVLIQL
jgi:hypothetical protein